MNEVVKNCRLCHSQLEDLVDIGEMALSGFFPQTKEEYVKSLPLALCGCDKCNLVQLKHDFDLNELYGEHYGYCSSLNKSMVKHLDDIRQYLENIVDLKDGDTIVDIGSNDGTLLNHYTNRNINYYGIDPSSYKFKNNYKEDITRINAFFTKEELDKHCNDKAKIVSTISMFYDLPDPLKFTQEIASIMHDDGIWFMEHSYLVTMIERMSYDTICHEHVEYYTLKPIMYMVDQYGLKIIDIQLNDTNGGSFALLLAKKSNNKFEECTSIINKFLKKEEEFFNKDTFKKFSSKINHSRDEVVELLSKLKKEGKKVHGYGASTKGNILLQYCNIDSKLLEYIAEVNEYKYGRFTPGTKISIISEEDSRKMNPEYFFVLPWHFKVNILKREKEFIENGGKVIFPLPTLQVIDKNNYNDHI